MKKQYKKPIVAEDQQDKLSILYGDEIIEPVGFTEDNKLIVKIGDKYCFIDRPEIDDGTNL